MSKNKKPDNSPKISQKEKLKDSLIIREFPWTEKQQQLIKLALDKKNPIIIIDGVAGTSKTLLAIYISLQLLNKRDISHIVYIRSLIQAVDGQLGTLPGFLEDKLKYFNIPLDDKLQELLTKPEINKLINEERIQTLPTSMLRGTQNQVQSWILDEAQNCTFDTLSTVLTRTGKFSKLFILGDSTSQNDLGRRSGFSKLIQLFNDEEAVKNGIVCIKFDVEDIMRSEIVKFIVRRLSKTS